MDKIMISISREESPDAVNIWEKIDFITDYLEVKVDYVNIGYIIDSVSHVQFENQKYGIEIPLFLYFIISDVELAALSSIEGRQEKSEVINDFGITICSSAILKSIIAKNIRAEFDMNTKAVSSVDFYEKVISLKTEMKTINPLIIRKHIPSLKRVLANYGVSPQIDENDLINYMLTQPTENFLSREERMLVLEKELIEETYFHRLQRESESG